MLSTVLSIALDSRSVICWILFALATALTPATARAAGSEAPIELNFLRLESPSCGSAPQALLCEPDPSVSLCDRIPERSLERARKLIEAEERMSFEILRLHGTERDFVRRNAAIDRVSRRTDAERGIAHMVDIFVRTFRRSTVLGPRAKNTLEKIVRRCTREPKLWIDGEDGKQLWIRNGRNGAIRIDRHTFSGYHRSRIAERMRELEGRVVNVLEEDFPGCELVLAGRLWLDCADGSASCAPLLFHELSHLINSCVYLSMAYAAESGEPSPVSSAIARAGREIGGELHDSTECLSGISGPWESLPNACLSERGRSPGELEAMLRRRCGRDQFRYPGDGNAFASQWNEAEADFWAASAMATYLSEIYSDPVRRQAAMADAITLGCAEERVEELRVAGMMEGVAKQRSLERAMANPLRVSYDGRFAREQDFRSRGGCEQRPDPALLTSHRDSSGRFPLHADTHQASRVRYDRNLLRNTDLRRTLGCPASPEVPLTCSPLGRTVITLPGR